MREDEHGTARFGELFAAQALRWSQRSLAELCDPGVGPVLWDPAVVGGWDPAWLASVDIDAWVREIIKWVYGRQQFLNMDPGAVREAVVRAVGAAAQAGPVVAMQGFQRAMVAMVRAQVPGRVVDVVCGEYSAQLQLKLLGLSEVRGPALDVGCGEQRLLVTALRAGGVEAVGIDRVHGDDWFDVKNYGSERWATVVSHHALSLHFLHHHFNKSGAMAMAYARTYMEILRSLRSGGVFAYAPGLPFIEGMLPAGEYRVVRQAVAMEAGDSALRAAIGMDVEYAAQVWRLR